MPVNNPTILPSDHGATLSQAIHTAGVEGTVLLVALGHNAALEARAVALGDPPLRCAIFARDRDDIAATVAGLGGMQADLAVDHGFSISTGQSICDVIQQGEAIDNARVELSYTAAEVGC